MRRILVAEIHTVKSLQKSLKVLRNRAMFHTWCFDGVTPCSLSGSICIFVSLCMFVQVWSLIYHNSVGLDVITKRQQ